MRPRGFGSVLGLILLLCPPLAAQPTPKAEALYNKGMESARSGDWQGAVTSYKEAVRLDPNFADAHANLAHAYNNLRRHDDAFASIQKALRLDARNVTAHLNLGVLHTNLKQWAEAEKAFDKALEIDPNSVGAHYGIGYLSLRSNRTDGAFEAFHKVLGIEPDSHLGRYGLGLAHLAAGDREAAKVERERLRDRNPRMGRELDAAITAAETADANRPRGNAVTGAIQSGQSGDWGGALGYLMTGLLFALPAAWFAHNRGHSPLAWGLVTLFMPLLFVATLFLRKRTEAKAAQSP